MLSQFTGPDMSLTCQQSLRIKLTSPALVQYRERIIDILHRDLLRHHPELIIYFDKANRNNYSQPRALLALILQFANNVNHTFELAPEMERICHRHCSIGIQPEHYAILGKQLIEAFIEVVDPIIAPETKAAWTDAYRILANMLIAREQQLYSKLGNQTGW